MKIFEDNQKQIIQQAILSINEELKDKFIPIPKNPLIQYINFEGVIFEGFIGIYTDIKFPFKL